MFNNPSAALCHRGALPDPMGMKEVLGLPGRVVRYENLRSSTFMALH